MERGVIAKPVERGVIANDLSRTTNGGGAKPAAKKNGGCLCANGTEMSSQQEEQTSFQAGEKQQEPVDPAIIAELRKEAARWEAEAQSQKLAFAKEQKAWTE